MQSKGTILSPGQAFYFSKIPSANVNIFHVRNKQQRTFSIYNGKYPPQPPPPEGFLYFSSIWSVLYTIFNGVFFLCQFFF